MALLLADENFPRAVVEVLRTMNHDVVTVQEFGHGNRKTPDEGVLDLAKSDRRAVLTLDRDFLDLHRRSSDHAGIIICTVDRDYTAQAIRIDAAVTACLTLDGKLLRVNRPAK